MEAIHEFDHMLVFLWVLLLAGRVPERGALGCFRVTGVKPSCGERGERPTS